MSKPKQKLYVVHKYIFAESAHDALKKERRFRPDEIFLDDDWQKKNTDTLESAIGFHVEHEYKFYDDWAKKDLKRK